MSVPSRIASLSNPDRAYLAEKIREAGVHCVQPLPISAQAYLAWALWDVERHPLIWVLDGPRHLDLLHQDLLTLTASHSLLVACYPAREALPGRGGPPSPELTGERLRTLQECLARPGPAILVTCVQALMQRTLPPDALARQSMTFSVGESRDRDDAVVELEKCGYAFAAEVQAQGQAALRGGVLDVWPPSEPWPVRLEFFGSVIDSIRSFDPVAQRSMEKFARVNLPPPVENEPGKAGGRDGDLCDYVPAGSCWVWSDPESIRHHAEAYRESIGVEEQLRLTPTYRTLRERVTRHTALGQFCIGADGVRPESAQAMDLKPIEDIPAWRAEWIQPDIAEEARRTFLADLGRRAAEGWEVQLYFGTEGARDRATEMYRTQVSGFDSIHCRVGGLSEGFLSESQRFMAVAESDFYGRRGEHRGRRDVAARRPRAERATGMRLGEWTDLEPGDYVVHVGHGIGKYMGLFEIEFAGRRQEVMTIEYADGAKLYVPVAQAHLLTRYIGVGKQRPKLHAIGGRKWMKDRIVAEHAVRDLAASLLETQALRATRSGHAFPPDTPWQREFEGAFPFQETADQERAIGEVKQDMERSQPMDRLVCGDVGYGKTEVAMRAAFKAVTSGKQVAVLVPTTVLAQQHFDTFASRMAAFPIRIGMLSRFQTRAEQRNIVDQAASGAVDVVIGTHRLLQPDLRFRDLGLLVIDEEQRFGVEQKEHLKQLRTTVDILTLTATPIPRTLYLSLTGARDMSTIQTPPQERLPIETIVAENHDDVVRDAVLRELNRDGQVFYLHNRVKTIDRVKQRLDRLLPGVRSQIAHGQMPERELEAVMRRFIRGEFDVLLCTTIIESGVDIPNVNTILIERADRFGLSDLYQLRGRVGRYKHQAFAYLLLPRHGRLFDSARKRIGAIRRYSSLGAGFKLALRDLEIRGAGNLLGAQQSGHIAAVGFDLYCQLLKRSVARMKGEPVPPIVDVELKLEFIDLSTSAEPARAAVIPVTYIEDETLRVRAYRKIASASLEQDIEEIRQEFRDRFGPLPEPLERLLLMATVRILAAGRNIPQVETRDDKLMLQRGQDYVTTHRRFPRLKAESPTARLQEIIEILRTVIAA